MLFTPRAQLRVSSHPLCADPGPRAGPWGGVIGTVRVQTLPPAVRKMGSSSRPQARGPKQASGQVGE